MPDLSPDSILQDLQPLFHEALNDPQITVTRTSSAFNTPNWDSLAHIDLIEMVELHFKVKFALGELHEMKNVGDMIDMIIEKKEDE